MTKRICSIPDCTRPAAGRGWCGTHYALWRRNGTPATLPRPTSEERFWSKVDKTETCWLWTAALGHVDGYGYFGLNGTMRVAHRIAYEWVVGPIPEGAQLDHICRVRSCVNPAHLQPVTHRENHEHVHVRSDSRTGIRGVTWNKSRGRYVVYATGKGRRYHGGYFDSITDAEQAAIALRNSLMTNNLLDRP